MCMKQLRLKKNNKIYNLKAQTNALNRILDGILDKLNEERKKLIVVLLNIILYPQSVKKLPRA